MSNIFEKFQISSKISDSYQKLTKLLYVFDDNNGSNALIVTNDDKVLSLGSNQFGCCGFGHNNPVNVPQIIPELCHKGVKQFFSGIRFVFALTHDNELYSWGRNYWGQLCRGYASSDQNQYLKPDKICGYVSESIAQISCGQSHTLLLTTEGKVYGWGANDYGQVGCGEGTDSKITKLTHIRLYEAIRSVHCTFDRSFAVTTSGQVYSWGYNQSCQLGHDFGRNEFLFEPKLISNLQNIETVCPSTENTYFLSKNGFLYFCGSFRNNMNRESFQLIPTPIKPVLKINGLQSVFISKIRKAIATALSEDSIYLLSYDSLIKTNYKTVYEFYANEHQITYKTIDLRTDVKIKIEVKDEKDNKDNLNLPSRDDKPTDTIEFRRVSSINGLFENKFQVLDQIGSGGFGTVVKVRDVFDKQVYAIKKIEFDSTQADDPYMDRLLREVTTLAAVRDDGIVRYMSSWIEHNNCLYIQMEYCSDNLKNIIKSKALVFERKPYQSMSVTEYFISCQLLKELLECVQYLHELKPPIIHRDLKPQNILIADNPQRGKYLKICDFGLATVHAMSSIAESHTRNTGTFKYTAPEVLQGTNCKSDYNTKADVYSMSVIAMEIFDFDINSSDNNRTHDELLGLKWNVLGKQIEAMQKIRHRDRPTCANVLAAQDLWTVDHNIVAKCPNHKLVMGLMNNYHNQFYYKYFIDKFKID